MGKGFKKEKRRLRACILKLKELAFKEGSPVVFDDESGIILLTLASNGFSIEDWQDTFFESNLQYSEYLDYVISNDLVSTTGTIYQIIIIRGNSRFSLNKNTNILCDISLSAGLEYLNGEATLLMINYFIKQNDSKIDFDWVAMINPTKNSDLNNCTFCLRIEKGKEESYILPIKGTLGDHNWHVFANASFQVK